MSDIYSRVAEAADKNNFPDYLNTRQVLQVLEEIDYPLLKKEIDFRRNVIEINGKNFGPEIEMGKRKGYGNSYVVYIKKLADYLETVTSLSVEIDYRDAKRVVEAYDLVLQRSRKYGMRGQRNFTGKIEDEIRGKLVEVGFEKYAKKNSKVDFLIDFELIDPKTAKRDKGDFMQIQAKGSKIIDLPEELTFSVKSTAGFFLGVPENELEWEGNYFILAKLHIKEDFLYKVLKTGFGLEKLNYTERLGWFEIRGFIDKENFRNKEKSLYSYNFPGKYALENKFRQANFIRTPYMLNRKKDDLLNIFQKIKNFENKAK